MSEYSTLIQEYYTNPVNNYRIEDATVSHHEGNPMCGDDITVYIKLSKDNIVIPLDTKKIDQENTIISQRSYDGNVSMITQAAASFFSELVLGKTVSQVLQLQEQLMIDQGFEVSTRRRRARSIPILATRNALHTFLGDGKIDEFDDVLGE